MNVSVIAVDQDTLGKQGVVVSKQDGTMVFSKPLADGSKAVALYNSTDRPVTISTTAAQVGFARASGYSLNDLWTHQTTETGGRIAAAVPPRGAVLFRVRPLGRPARYVPRTRIGVQSPSVYDLVDAVIRPAHSIRLASMVSDDGNAAVRDVRVTASAPNGWTVTPRGSPTQAHLGAGKSFTTGWTLRAPPDAHVGKTAVTYHVGYRVGGKTRTLRTGVRVLVVRAPPAGATFLGDRAWVTATNGFGPVERNTSNGENAPGDGHPMSIRGVHYARGLGTHSISDVVFYLGGKCSRLLTFVGIDDEEEANGGSVAFVVYGGDTNTGEKKLASSGVVTNLTKAARKLDVDVTGARWLRLHLGALGDTTYDHGDWAKLQLTC